MWWSRYRFRLAEEDDNRELVRLHGGLELLCSLLNDYDNQENKELMAAVTGAIWKCATNNPQNVERFEELELMNILIQLLRDNSDALDDLQFNPQKMSVLTNGTSTYSMVPNNSAARLLIFKIFSLPTRLIWTYTLIKIQIIFLPTRLLSTIFTFLSIFNGFCSLFFVTNASIMHFFHLFSSFY